MRLFLIVLLVIVKEGDYSVDATGPNEKEGFDEDDDIDPYDDDGEPIQYPAKSVMPERAMSKDDPIVLPKEGSGNAPQKAVLDFQMANRLENLEKSLVFLTTKLSQQQMANNDLVAALAAQNEQRVKEKSAFVNAVGVLQGAVTQLANRVESIPKAIKQDKRQHYKDDLTSKINIMSERIGKLGNRISKKATEDEKTLDVRSHDAASTNARSQTGELLGKLLGKDLEKALEGITSKNNGQSEAKDIASAAGQAPAAASPVAPLALQSITPIDLQPQSHLTSTSTPTGQGPAGSISSNPVQPNFSFVQVPSQTNIAAPSTPTGSGPVGSVSTMPAAQLTPELPQTVSLTSFASKFKPPTNVGGYNVLPLVPAAPVTVPQQPLEPPGIISPQPELPSLTDTVLPVPGAVNPYEVLTSSQMQPKIAQPLGFTGAAPLPALPQSGNPYELLTTSQAMLPGNTITKAKVNDGKAGKKAKIKQERKTKKKVVGHKIRQNLKDSIENETKEKTKKHEEKEQNTGHTVHDGKSGHHVQNKSSGHLKDNQGTEQLKEDRNTGFSKVEQGKGAEHQTINQNLADIKENQSTVASKQAKSKLAMKLAKDPVIHALVKAMKIGHLKKDELFNEGKKKNP